MYTQHPRQQPSLRAIILVTLAVLSAVYAAGFGGYWAFAQPQASTDEPLAVFWEAWEHVEGSFYGPLPSSTERTYGAIRGLLALLDDPYTVLVEPQPRQLERDRLRGAFGGVGVAVWRDTAGRIALSPYPDSPAERAGAEQGDIVLAINFETITETVTVDDVKSRLRGEVGTPVTLTLSRPPAPPFDLTITREEIRTPSLTWRVLDQAPEVGYLHIESFTERTPEELLEALQQLETEGARALILDLRGNFGGLLGSAVTVLSQFIDTGTALYEVRRGSEENSRPLEAGGAALDIPTVVLVDHSTASAAEIVAGALQDYERAPLIGEPTFGKGSVQLIFDLSNGASVHVTSAVWLTPARREIQGQGLTPDIFVAHTDGIDAPLERALRYLQMNLFSEIGVSNDRHP
jgi:carboxyl-terminal processing protease